MENVFIQVGKEELKTMIDDAVKSALATCEPKQSNETFIKGIHELAKFLKVSPAKAQKLKNEGAFPFWQDGRTLLFDPIKVRAAMNDKK